MRYLHGSQHAECHVTSATCNVQMLHASVWLDGSHQPVQAEYQADPRHPLA